MRPAHHRGRAQVLLAARSSSGRSPRPVRPRPVSDRDRKEPRDARGGACELARHRRGRGFRLRRRGTDRSPLRSRGQGTWRPRHPVVESGAPLEPRPLVRPEELEERGPAPRNDRAETVQVTADAKSLHDGPGVQQNVLARDQSGDHGPTPSPGKQSTRRAIGVLRYSSSGREGHGQPGGACTDRCAMIRRHRCRTGGQRALRPDRALRYQSSAAGSSLRGTIGDGGAAPSSSSPSRGSSSGRCPARRRSPGRCAR